MGLNGPFTNSMDKNDEIIKALKPYLPRVKKWIIDYVREHSLEARSISDFHFSQLSQYYTKRILDATKIVIVDKVEMIPLARLGVPGFDEFEHLNASGVTYFNTYFIHKDYSRIESVHFHELVHIVQWNHLGIDRFLLLYGLGLKENGYRSNPLEIQAYELQEQFENSKDCFDVEYRIIPALDKMTEEVLRIKRI